MTSITSFPRESAPIYFPPQILTKYSNFELTSTWVALGDSYTAGGAWGTPWANFLRDKTNTTLINRGISSTTADEIGTANISNDFVLSSNYSSVSSVVLYGFNDIRNNKTLYSNSYHYSQMLVGVYLTMCVPQNKIQLVRDASWVKTGTWLNSPVYNFGIYSATQNDYIEKSGIVGRYYGFRFTGLQAVVNTIEIFIDGVSVSEIQRTNLVAQSQNYHCFGVVIDMQTSASRTIRITNKSASAQNTYIDFVASWEDNDFFTRSLLVCVPPTFDYAFTGSTPWDAPSDAKRLMIVQSIRNVVNTLSKRGLPVFLHETSVADGVLFTDDIHWNSTMAQAHASDLIKNSISNF